MRLATNDLRLATNDLRLATNDLRLATNDLRLATNDLRLATNDLRLATNDLRHATNDLRHATNDLRHKSSPWDFLQIVKMGEVSYFLPYFRGVFCILNIPSYTFNLEITNFSFRVSPHFHTFASIFGSIIILKSITKINNRS